MSPFLLKNKSLVQLVLINLNWWQTYQRLIINPASTCEMPDWNFNTQLNDPSNAAINKMTIKCKLNHWLNVR